MIFDKAARDAGLWQEQTCVQAVGKIAYMRGVAAAGLSPLSQLPTKATLLTESTVNLLPTNNLDISAAFYR